jgi:hypothetical protein
MILTFVSTMDIQWTSNGGRTTLPCRPDRRQIPGNDDIQLDAADGEGELRPDGAEEVHGVTPALGRNHLYAIRDFAVRLS